jgi:hypothetical protein
MAAPIYISVGCPDYSQVEWWLGTLTTRGTQPTQNSKEGTARPPSYSLHFPTLEAIMAWGMREGTVGVLIIRINFNQSL